MKLAQITAASLVVLTGLSLSSTAVYAAEVGTRDTTATFQVEAGDDEGTTDPIKPIDPVVPPMKGKLTLDAASNLDFGSVKLGAGTGTYDAVVPDGSVLGMQVTDSRGTGPGWNVGVKISAFTGTKPTNTLKGAKVTIPMGSLETTSADPLKVPVAAEVLLTEKSTPIFTAAKDMGMGSWANLFEGKGKKVTLAVPDGNYVDTYTATLTWALQDAPK